MYIRNTSIGTGHYEIITREDGQWVPVEERSENIFASEAEAWQGVEALRALGEDWAAGEYDVRELDADELAARRLPSHSTPKGENLTMNLTQFAHFVGIALGHAGAIEADAQVVRWAIERDALAEYVAATALARVRASTPHDSPLAMAGFRPVVIDGALAYGHRSTSGRLTVDLFPEAGTATLRIESAGDRHVLTVHLLFTGGELFASIEAGDLSLIEERPDRLNLLGRIDQQCGGRIRAALESAAEGGADDDAIQGVLDALDALEREAAGV